MFESAELGHALSKSDYEREVAPLREALLEVQYQVLEAARFPIIVVIGGVDGAGKGETVNLLNTWLDPRHIQTRAMLAPSAEERERPRMWRFWRALPAKGKLGVFVGSWYTMPILDRVHRRSTTSDLDGSVNEIVRFERMLTDEGALLLKFWFHLSKAQQKKRLNNLAKDPRTRWRVTPTDWQHFELYDRFRRVSERTLRDTSSAEAPWLVVEGSEERYRSLTVGKSLLTAMQSRLDDGTATKRAMRAPPIVPPIDGLHVLKTLDLGQKIAKKEYEDELPRLQGRLALATRTKRFTRRSLVVVFEGADAAGKGGAIRRVTEALDARQYDVIPIAAPSEDERAHPYLWRFWRRVPERGRIAIFDRSWYGRVLVERVEGYASEADWLRAYSEITDFEEQLVASGTVVVKLWLQISKDEQLRRFEERKEIAFKRYKITEEDWRNREKWDAYEVAVADMVDRTSSAIAPWTLVEANDKLFSRIKILRTIADRLEADL